jgi:hypothetical protein
MVLIGSPNRPAHAAHQGLPIRQHRLSLERNAGTLHLLWLTEIETSQRVSLRRPRGSAARRSRRSRRSKTGGPGPALRVSRVNVLLGRRSLVRARKAQRRECRAILWRRKSCQDARTSWWWTQSCETGLRGPNSLLTGKITGNISIIGCFGEIRW